MKDREKPSDNCKFIHAYELDNLSKEDREQFEIHLLDCDSCFAEVTSFDQVSAVLTKNKELRVTIEKLPDGGSRGGSLWRKLLRHFWPDINFFLRPAIMYLIIVLLIYPSYHGIRRDESNSVRPVTMLHLLPERSGQQHIVLSEGDLILSFVFPGAKPGRKYIVELKSGGNVVYSDNYFEEFTDRGIGSLILPRSILVSGQYSLLLVDIQEKSLIGRREYKFLIE